MHPTQIYDSINAFIIFLLLQWIYKNKKFHGQVFAVYGMFYAVSRSIVEVFRGDKIRGFLISDILSTSQFIAILIFSAAAYLYWNRHKVKIA